MNMKRLLTLFFASLMALIIISCAPTKENRLIGTWKTMKVEKYDVAAIPTQSTTTSSVPSRGSKTADTTANGGVKEATKFEKQLERLIINEQSSTLVVNKDKTATKELMGKTIHATWKLQNKGKSMVVNSKETGKSMTFNILHVNDTSAVVLESFPFGSLKVTYHKVKK
jgi:hypothetical protein